MKRSFILLLIFIFSGHLSAQEFIAPLNSTINLDFEEHVLLLNYVHTDFRPINQLKKDSLYTNYIREQKSWLYRKLKAEDFALTHSTNYYLAANPLLNYQKMSNDSIHSWYQNTRGIEIKARIGQKVYVNSRFYENQAEYPFYIDNYIQKHLVVPGQGATKIFKVTQHDFSQAEAYLSWQAFKDFNLTLGHGKSFIGNGYRSMLWSDFAYSYPFFRIQYEHSQWQYTAQWVELENFYYKYYARHYRKTAAIQYLSRNFLKTMTLGFFQSVIWQSQIDGKGRVYPFELFSPIPLIQPLTYGMQNENNVLMGLNFNYHLKNYFQIYAQLAVDDLKPQSMAWQSGIFIPNLSFDLIPHLQISFRAEINKAGQAVYAHIDSIQSYTHYNEALAHPAGNDFQEILFHWQMRFHDFFITAFYNQIDQNQATNAFKLLQSFVAPVSEQYYARQNIRLEAGYIINRKTFLQIFAGYYQYKNKMSQYPSQNYMSFGIRTYLENRYYAL